MRLCFALFAGKLAQTGTTYLIFINIIIHYSVAVSRAEWLCKHLRQYFECDLVVQLEICHTFSWLESKYSYLFNSCL